MELFDQIAAYYDDWYEDKKGKFVDDVQARLVFNIADVKEGDTVLDAGCGTGNFSEKLARKGCKVTGVDVSSRMLEIAKKKVEDTPYKIDYKKMDVHNLDFNDETFDAVFVMTAFEFLDNQEDAFTEMFRVLKKGGSLLIGTISREGEWGKLYQENANETVFEHAHFKTLEEMLGIHTEKIAEFGECLFVSPDADEDHFELDKDIKLSPDMKGSFMCVKWIK